MLPVSPFQLTDRRILVTGGSSGIGRDVSIVLASLGARIVVSGRNAERLDATLQSLPGSGHLAAPFDLAELDAIPAWIKSLAGDAPFDGLVHSAGIQTTVPLRTINAAAIDKVIHTNLSSAILLARGFAQKSCSNPGSSLVFISSVMGLVSKPLLATYSASKAALSGLARSLALELAPSRTRVNCVAPAFVATEMLDNVRNSIPEEQFALIEKAHPLGFGTPRDVACSVAFLLADASRWITGSTLVVDGGYSAQ